MYPWAIVDVECISYQRLAITKETDVDAGTLQQGDAFHVKAFLTKDILRPDVVALVSIKRIMADRVCKRGHGGFVLPLLVFEHEVKSSIAFSDVVLLNKSFRCGEIS